MLDRFFTSLLLLAALAWAIASFAAAPHLASPAPKRPVMQVELPRVLVTARREGAPAPLAHNQGWQPAAQAVR